MTNMGQLQPGVVQVVKPGTSTVIGYVFTVEDGNGGQLQRWLLHENPSNALEIKPPPATMSCWTLADWQANVKNLWKPGSIYVWAQADVYIHGGTYNGTSWNQIPPASALPSATYPDVDGVGLQLEYSCGGDPLRVHQPSGCEGLVFTVGSVSETSSVEYWMLPASYEAAGGTSRSAAVVTKGTTASAGSCVTSAVSSTSAELQQFIDQANQRWTPGSRFVITGCVNYHEATAPGAP